MIIMPRASPKILTKTFPTDSCVFGRFGQLSPGSNHSGGWPCLLDSNVWWWIYVSFINTNQIKKSVYAEISKNCAPIDTILFLVLLENAATISHRTFAYTNVQAKYSSHILSTSLRCQLSPSLSICGQPRQYNGFYFC